MESLRRELERKKNTDETISFMELARSVEGFRDVENAASFRKREGRQPRGWKRKKNETKKKITRNERALEILFTVERVA